MHPRIEHLLSLRDGEPVPADVREHVASCVECAGRVADATLLRDRLRALPQAPTIASASWPAVQARLGQRRVSVARRAAAARVAVAASLAVLAVAVGWRLADESLDSERTTAASPSPSSAEDAVALDRVARLQSQSQALDEMLADFGDRPAVERAGTALPIDTLEGQVQWIDHQLSDQAGLLSPGPAEQLWRERVQAMNSLVRLRYVEAQRIAM